jgi:hypothetical protein
MRTGSVRVVDRPSWEKATTSSEAFKRFTREIALRDGGPPAAPTQRAFAPGALMKPLRVRGTLR